VYVFEIVRFQTGTIYKFGIKPSAVMVKSSWQQDIKPGMAAIDSDWQ
jgi:hypothetical protein